MNFTQFWLFEKKNQKTDLNAFSGIFSKQKRVKIIVLYFSDPSHMDYGRMNITQKKWCKTNECEKIKYQKIKKSKGTKANNYCQNDYVSPSNQPTNYFYYS